MNDEFEPQAFGPYEVRAATPEDLREFWRATNVLETFAEFEERVRAEPGSVLSLLREGKLIGVLEARPLPEDHVWLSLAPVKADAARECVLGLQGAVDRVLAGGCPRVWQLVVSGELAEWLTASGWQAGQKFPMQWADGTETLAQWCSLSRETWLCARHAHLN